jgi:hypothetical protein
MFTFNSLAAADTDEKLTPSQTTGCFNFSIPLECAAFPSSEVRRSL